MDNYALVQSHKDITGFPTVRDLMEKDRSRSQEGVSFD
jgi:hypothetical protein